MPATGVQHVLFESGGVFVCLGTDSEGRGQCSEAV